MVSVIISTFNQPVWLERVLWGYSCQTYRDFELIIADDGSNESTLKIVEAVKREGVLSIKHVYHENEGFRKCTILNKAVMSSVGDYLIFSDGDIIPRNDFVQVHVNLRRVGMFLSGGTVRLPADLSAKINAAEIRSGICFDRKWLENNGLGKSFKNNKLNASGLKGRFLNSFTPAGATWNGGNASAWKKDIMEVRGFDQRLRYGGEDREFGERLARLGVKGRQIRYSAVTLHLDHPRDYVHSKEQQYNKQIRRQNKKNGIIQTEYGLNFN
ncbi:MAG TPA: glycosyltransferase [Bacteroidales bacterium]|nr:glycosyltransferase [Bacteroidales bacterium]HRW94820.1 glycosyltransferase [Bacteroidales bacterium]